MVVSGEPNINNIMGGIENTGGVRLHNHRKKLKQRFDIIKKLGQGTYGKVQLGINKETGQEVAIKTIKKSKIETEADLVRIRREIQIMSSVQHPNIIHIYEVFENREKMILVMEYAAGGELYDYLSERKVLAEEEARRIFRQIATACYYCHKHKICHRDLKLENILLDENGNAKIADFGLSNIFDDQRLLSTYCGSPLYASPEIVKGTPYHGPEVDCWSLGVLLYTLVYGAMPFDGSNFKRLVKQISQGDYFEPKKPSRGSPLIREMLTVNPKYRANIEKICSHWWVNEGYEENCLEISEELANQTPVRLDLLLSLAPPPPQLESEKLVVTGETDESAMMNDTIMPTRSQSVGSLRELAHPTDRRIKDLLTEDSKSPAKRKLETTISTDQANLSREGIRRKEKIVKERTVADVTEQVPIKEADSPEDTSMAEAAPLDKSSTRTISKKMDIDSEENIDPSAMGAVCSEIIEDAKKNEAKQAVVKKTSSVVKEKTAAKKNAEITKDKNGEIKEEKQIMKENQEPEKKESPIKEGMPKDKENEKKVKKESKSEESKIPAKKKIVKKKVLTDKNENLVSKSEEKKDASPDKSQSKQDENKLIKPEEEPKEEEKISDKPVERRRSKIFETAEKFQNLISSNEKPSNEKSKKFVIPGVSVGGFKKEFERKASLTSSSNVPQLKNSASKKTVEKQNSTEQAEEPKLAKTEVTKPSVEEKTESKEKTENEKTEAAKQKTIEEVIVPKSEIPNADDERKKKAVSIISSVLDKEGARKSKSRPCVGRKPPIPFGSSGRSASGNIGVVPSQFDIKKEDQTQLPQSLQVAEEIAEEVPEESKISLAEITLKSATLPRRKTTKAEINLKYPTPKPAVMEFKTEMAHRVEAPPSLPTQRSEVKFPVSPPTENIRSSSLEAPTRSKQSRERIIPIAFEKEGAVKENIQSPPTKPPVKMYQTQKSTVSQRSESLSRQSTQESDSDTTSLKGEPIRKSPREYIIPIAVEGGGYVTPRAGSLEPSETTSTTSTMTNRSKFGRARRMSSLLNDREGSEDESPFSSLPRPNSFGKDSDNEDSKKDLFRMHSLRSSRPRKATLEHNDSFSSGEDDDDDGFEILTAENLFSTLLSRVRDLTSRLNVEEGRPGFPRSSLLTSNFFNFPNRIETLSRRSPLGRAFSREQSTDSTYRLGTPWRRSVTRDLSSDLNRVFNSSESPTHTATLPRGDKNKPENLNLLDLDLKKLKLSKEDALALSYLTPGLSRRIQKQLLAQLPLSEAKKLTRTMSMRESASEDYPKYGREKSFDSATDQPLTLPRRFSMANSPSRYQEKSVDRNTDSNISRIPEATSYSKCELPKVYEPAITNSRTKINELVLPTSSSRTSLPVKSPSRDYYSPFSDRTSKYEEEPQKPVPETDLDTECSPLEKYRRKRAARSASLREPKSDYLLPKPTPFVPYHSPDSSVSESLSSKNDDYFSCKNDNLLESSSKLNVPSSDSNRLNRFLSPSRYETSDHSDSERGREPRRISRFLRPDFFETRKEESTNPYLREKKEREMETQKVLKEIRDKRKSKMRERSASRERRKIEVNGKNSPEILDDNIEEKNSDSNLLTMKNDALLAKSTENLLKTVSDNIKNLETNVKNIHDYVNLSPVDFVSSEASISEDNKMHDYINVPASSLEGNVKNEVTSSDGLIPDYVNIKACELEEKNIPKKERVSKIARPKSYPTENISKRYATKIPPITENEPKSKISKLKKPEKREKVKESKPVETGDKLNGKEVVEKSKDKETGQKVESKEDKEKLKERSKSKEKEISKKLKYEGEKPSNKNKLLQSIEKKFEKLRSFNNSPTTNVEENKSSEKKSSVENTIKRLREQSVPGDIDTCITESGLIKRAVSVEDFPSLGVGAKNLQTSKKSVTKILNLFKKYEEKDKKGEKLKTKKSKENDSSSESKSKDEPKGIDTIEEKTDDFNDRIVGANTVMSANSGSVSPLKHIYQNVPAAEKCPSKYDLKESSAKDSSEKSERPRSLLLEKMKHFQNAYAGAKSDSLLVNDKPEKKTSKLPINSFRRSLNLENSYIEPPKFYKTPNAKSTNSEQQHEKHGEAKNIINKDQNESPNSCENKLERKNENINQENIDVNSEVDKPDRSKLHLDFSKIPSYSIPKINIESNTNPEEEVNGKENRNSLVAPIEDNSTFFSQCEDADNTNDSWSICSDYHTQDLTSPVSPTGQFYSADEGESVIDRIRRKSFYTRFNEKKKPRKTSLTSYKDLDLYKNLGYRNPGYRSPTNYGTLEQKPSKREPPFDRKMYYQEPATTEYKGYKENTFSNHGYVNLPRYNTYNPRLGRACYSMDEEGVLSNSSSTAGRSKMYSYLRSPSKFSTRSVSPNIEMYSDTGSSLNQNISNSPTSASPV